MVTVSTTMHRNSSTQTAPPRAPTASVLLPVYNTEPGMLDSACRSILAQTFQDFELLIIDDGSNRKDTLRWLDDFATQDARVRVIHEPHRSLTPTLNVGLRYCRGEFIFRHDADDWSAPDRLQTQIQFLRSHPELGVVGSWIMLHQDDQTPLWIDCLPTQPHDITAAFPKQNPYCHGAICFRRTAAEQIGGYREEFNTSQDYDFLWRLSERFGGANLPQVLYHRRFTPSSISTNRALDQARNRALARRLGALRAANQPENIPQALQEISADLNDRNLSALSTQGDYLLLSGYRLSALKKYLHAIVRTPWRRLPYLKTFRWALYMLAPRLRPRLFGHRDPERQQPVAKTPLAA